MSGVSLSLFIVNIQKNRYNVPSLFVTTFATTDSECHDAAQKQSAAALSDKETGAMWFEDKSDGEPISFFQLFSFFLCL